MKKNISTSLIVIGALIASVSASAKSLGGFYRAGFGQSYSAELQLTGTAKNLQAYVSAQGASCVLRFSTGALIALQGSEEFYSLPVTETCGGPRGFGAFRTLLIERNASGSISSAKIFGSNGKTSWTYFRSN